MTQIAIAFASFKENKANPIVREVFGRSRAVDVRRI